MRKNRKLLPILCTALCLTAGCQKSGHEQTELVLFAAASLTESLTELGSRYMEEHEDVTVVFNFDSSGTLKTQIQEGADCDIFISAGQKQIDQLDGSAPEEVNTERLDFVLDGSRRDILENKVALAVPKKNPAGIRSYQDMKEGLEAGRIMLAVGNEDVPVGQYAQKILEFFGLDEDVLAEDGCITYGSNVKEVATQIAEGIVDCGMIYQTDAFSAGLTVVDTASSEMCGRVIYPAAVLNGSGNVEAAQSFLAYLQSDEADEVFKKTGFTPVD